MGLPLSKPTLSAWIGICDRCLELGPVLGLWLIVGLATIFFGMALDMAFAADSAVFDWPT